MFFRIKKIRGNEYAYIVENEWKRKGSRQKVKAYIGRAYRFNLENDADFLKYFSIKDTNDYVKNNSKEKVVNDLIMWELFRFGIKKEEFLIDISKSSVKKNKRNAVLLLNEGFMCNLTLRNLLEFKPSDPETDGYRLARAFVEAGIKIPEDIFVALCQKAFGF